MTKKILVLLSISMIISILVLSVGIVFIKKPKKEKGVYFATPTITKVYCKRIKTFPAPYELVGGLPTF